METLDKIAEWFYNLFHHYNLYNHNHDFVATFVELIVFIIIVLFILALIIYGIYSYYDDKLGTNKPLQGILIDKHYKGEEHYSGSGVGIANGGIAVVSTSSTSEEEFMLFIRADKVYKIKCDIQQFYQYKIGDNVNFSVRIGRYSKDDLNSTLK
jgi:Tfp pilus assembly protein PilE